MLILRLVTSVLALQTVLGGSFECNGDHIMLVHVYREGIAMLMLNSLWFRWVTS